MIFIIAELAETQWKVNRRKTTARKLFIHVNAGEMAKQEPTRLNFSENLNEGPGFRSS